MIQAYALTLDTGLMVALKSKVPMLKDGASATWIQVAVNGTWEGHPTGPFAFDSKAMTSIVANFEAQANPVPLTYEHPDHNGSGQPIPAAGWIREMATRADGLWAKVEFTDRAAEMVRAGEYRFCSVVVNFASTSRTTGDAVGPELYEIGLVNTPFLDGMQPITLSRRHSLAAGATTMNDAALIKEAVKVLGPEVTMEKLATWVTAKKAILAIEAGDPVEGETLESAEGGMAAVEAGETVDASRKLEAAPPAAPAVALAEGVDSAAGTAPDDAVDDTDPAVQAAAAATLAKLGEAAGMSLADTIASLEADLDAFAALLTGAPVDGTEAVPGDEAAGAMLSRAQSSDLRVALTASKAATASATAEIVKLRAEGLTRDLADAVKAGKIGDIEAKTLTSFIADSPDKVRERVTEALGSEDTVAPTAPVIKASGKGNKTVKSDETSPDYLIYEGSLRGSIKDPKERAAEAHRLMASRDERNEKRAASRRRRTN